MVTTSRYDDGFVIWLTGLSVSGKSTLARRLERDLVARARRVAVLDDDGAWSRPGAPAEGPRADRDAETRRLAAEALGLARQGAIVIAAAISPSRHARNEARQAIGRFVEVFVDCPLETCVARDAAGLYRRALAGELADVPGISAPYEAPRSAEVVVPSATDSPEAGAARVLRKLADLGYLSPGPDLSPGPFPGRVRAVESETTRTDGRLVSHLVRLG
jgi:adenylyl-sulfate kinase